MEEKKTFFERHSLLIKLGVIGVLILMLLIPISMVDSLIDERQQTQNESVVEVTSKWGEAQRIVGPVLGLHNNTKLYTDTRVQILPENLDIKSTINTQTLKRGMYDIIVYNTTVVLSGHFSLPHKVYNDGKLAIDSNAYINVGMADLKGLTQQVTLDWGGDKSILSPGIEQCSILSSGVNGRVDLSAFVECGNKVPFTITLDFNGSQSLEFAPLGVSTTAAIKSNFTNPSFGGNFLPQNRTVAHNGFEADWKVLSINRNYPQVIVGDRYQYNMSETLFGVRLIAPVEQYLQATRAMKYAFLIIILTFALTFFVETVQKKNIHPLQYLLIGLTLCIFYTLLVSMSEHVGFALAYLIASIMTVSLITLYMIGVLKIKKTALTIGAVLAVLYGYIYVLVQMESYALITGSIGLFVIMAAIMYFSLKIKFK